MTTAPATIKANFMWDHDRDGEPRRIAVVGHNTGHLDEMITEECGCVRAVYVLDDCGGPADLIVQRCDGTRIYGCDGERYMNLSGFRIEVVA
jgi:hypothetical protein